MVEGGSISLDPGKVRMEAQRSLRLPGWASCLYSSKSSFSTLCLFLIRSLTKSSMSIFCLPGKISNLRSLYLGR